MRFQRGQLLRMLSLAFGSVFVFGSKQVAFAQSTGEPASGAGGADVERVTGIGGFFFRAHDPKALNAWYAQHLGITPVPMKYSDPSWQQEAGTTAFSAFPETTGYFGDPKKDWMINFRVRDLDKIAAQLTAAGIAVKVDPTTYPNGRFARLQDPEGNPIELWQPAG
jgi:glyoxylase I family protein